MKDETLPLWMSAGLFVLGFDCVIILLAAIGPPLATTTFAHLTAERLFNGMGTVLATFIGAWMAFTFAKRNRALEKIETDVAAGNRALFTLMSMWNQMALYQRAIVDPYRGKPDAWLNLHVGSPLNDGLSLETKELSFVLQASPKTFLSVMLEDDRYKLIVKMIEDHRDIVLEKAWPLLEAAGMKLEDSMDEQKLHRVIGPGTVKRLKVTTAGIIEMIDDNLISSQEAFAALRNVLINLHGGREFLDIGFGPPKKKVGLFSKILK